MPGDHVVTVPDGTYTGAEVTAPHAETQGPYGGWLILVAEHQGGVTVDLSNAPARQLWLHEGTSRIAFIGFSFRNGVIRNEGQFMRFWYCDHQDPDYDYLDAHRETPRMFQTYNGGDNLEVYGSDFHNGTATAVYFGSLVDNVTLQGVRIFAIDPKFGDVLDPLSHIVPMGSPPGSHKNFRILDTYLEGYYTLWGTNSGSISDMTWQNIWYGFGYGSPFLLAGDPRPQGRGGPRASTGRSSGPTRTPRRTATTPTSTSTTTTTAGPTRSNTRIASTSPTPTSTTAIPPGSRAIPRPRRTRPPILRPSGGPVTRTTRGRTSSGGRRPSKPSYPRRAHRRDRRRRDWRPRPSDRWLVACPLAPAASTPRTR